MCTAIKLITNLLNTIKEVENLFNYNYDNINIKDKETQDLLHEIELSKFNASEGYVLAKKLQTVRQDRRRMKDENEQLFYLKEAIDKNKNFKEALKQAHSKIDKNLQNLNTRKYTPKVNENLAISTTNTSKEVKNQEEKPKKDNLELMLDKLREQNQFKWM